MPTRLFGLPVAAIAATLGFAGAAAAVEVPAATLAQAPALATVAPDPMPTSVIAPLPPRRAEVQRTAARSVPLPPRVASYQPVRMVHAQPARAVCHTPRCGPLMMTGVTY
jgi:hypothetical protein